MMVGGLLGHVTCGITGGVGLSRGGEALEQLGADYNARRVGGYWTLYASQAVPWLNIVTIPSVPLVLIAERQKQERAFTDIGKTREP